MVTFVEAPIFSKHVHDYISDEEYADFQLYLATNPDSGDIDSIPGHILKALKEEMEHVSR